MESFTRNSVLDQVERTHDTRLHSGKGDLIRAALSSGKMIKTYNKRLHMRKRDLFNAVLSSTTTQSAFSVSRFRVSMELYGWTTTSDISSC